MRKGSWLAAGVAVLAIAAAVIAQTTGTMKFYGDVFTERQLIIEGAAIGLNANQPVVYVSSNNSTSAYFAIYPTGNTGVGTTTPATMLDVAGPIGVWSRTKAQIDLLQPTAVGQIVFCSNCATAVLCASSGTAAAQWVSVAVGTATTRQGCGTNSP